MKAIVSLITLLVAAGSLTARADVRLPAIFSDHMVVQANAPVPIWGWAEPGEEVAVSLGGESASGQAGTDGKWMVKLGQLKPSAEPQTLTVHGKNSRTVTDVLVGDVWLGSGQSNMAFTVSRAKDAQTEIAQAAFPSIRMFTVASGSVPTPQPDCVGKWAVCTPATVGRFSAALFFFGRELHQTLQTPVGLIHSSVGGTPIEAWTDADVQAKSPELKGLIESKRAERANFDLEKAKATYQQELASWREAVAKARAEGSPLPKPPRNTALIHERSVDFGGLFNGKIAPLIPYAIRGVVWYQGEANASAEKAPYYQYQLPLLIEDWRARWGYEFPFAWVQLPNLESNPEARQWPLVREAMLKTLRLPHTGMAIAIDLGDPKNLHPANKQGIGHRLALWALGAVYGQKVPAISGPLPNGQEMSGGEITVKFRFADGGLVIGSQSGGGVKEGELKGFVIAGEDRQWKPAHAEMHDDRVTLSSPEVKQPVAVRYDWANNPDGNLYNAGGLPASPFRTDDWK
jgi:sialate O-acetylesterase